MTAQAQGLEGCLCFHIGHLYGGLDIKQIRPHKEEEDINYVHTCTASKGL